MLNGLQRIIKNKRIKRINTKVNLIPMGRTIFHHITPLACLDVCGTTAAPPLNFITTGHNVLPCVVLKTAFPISTYNTVKSLLFWKSNSQTVQQLVKDCSQNLNLFCLLRMSFVDSVLVFDARAKVRLLFALDKNRTKLLQEKTSVLDWVILSGELKNARIKKKIVLHFIFSLPAFLFLALETVPNERGKLIDPREYILFNTEF